MVIDSNIIIYAAQPEHDELRRFVADNSPAISAISYVEVLGFHSLSDEDRRHFEEFFGEASILPITQPVLDKAVELRQAHRMSLGDALVAATCLVHNRTLVTRNTQDFAWIPALQVLDPFQLPPPAQDGDEAEDEGETDGD